MITPSLLQDFLEGSAERFPKKTALKHKDQEITYQDLLADVQAFGHYLKTKNIQRMDRVGIFIDKSIKQVIALLGTLYADAVFVVINPALHDKQVEHIINDCQIKLVVTEETLSDFEKQKELIVSKNAMHRSSTCQNITDDIATIVYTSGSTGLPKGIVITHRNLIDGAKIVSQYLNITAQERILGLLPLNFDYGLNQLTSTLYMGCTLVLFQYFMPNSLLQILEKENITGLAAIPTIWTSVFNSKMAKLDGYDFSKLRYITNSGGKIPVPIVKKIRETFKTTDLYLMYGLTEAFRSTYLDPKEVDRHPDSMGKAIPNVQIEVINDKGEVCKPGEEGELIHRGACIARGYWNNPEKTAQVYKPNPLLPKENQFLETVVYSGDLVKKDTEGFLYFIGRRDGMIKSGGYRVSPTEVEELLLSCPGVAEAVVFGLADDTLGYKIRAVVTLSKQLTKDEIINHCKANAPMYLVPQEIFIREAFGKTASGKLDRPKIIAESKKDHGL
jgi:amino acid adenylation domain-containing protein